jgi:hypothetical protein
MVMAWNCELGFSSPNHFVVFSGWRLGCPLAFLWHLKLDTERNGRFAGPQMMMMCILNNCFCFKFLDTFVCLFVCLLRNLSGVTLELEN